MKSLKEILRIFEGPSPRDAGAILEKLPGKNCGICGFPTCGEFAGMLLEKPEAISRCIFLGKPEGSPVVEEHERENIPWKDILGREYDFILDRFPNEPGPRETILPFNPANVERLQIKKGDVLYGRPAWAGCPVTHCGVVMETPDYFNGLIEWCVVGPLEARERGIHIGHYNPIAYEGLVLYANTELRFGRRYYFLPRHCMLQSRHSGVLNMLAKTSEGMRARLEGIMLS